MSEALIAATEQLTSAQDELQLRQLDEAICSIKPEDVGQREIRALLSVFERFPEDDGYETFWSIVHCLEACEEYETALIESVIHTPAEFNLLMVNRLLNGGVTEIQGQSLLSVLASAAANTAARDSARKSAQDFIEYQSKRRYADA